MPKYRRIPRASCSSPARRASARADSFWTWAAASLPAPSQARAAGLKQGGWDPLILEGDASQCLLEQEEERHADLVVMGKHGRSATEDLLLGSVTKHVLDEGSADVLVSTRHGE